MQEYLPTKFVNIDDEAQTFYFNKSKEPNGYTFKAGEEREIPKAMAETFAKHLVDIVLNKKGVKDTMRDTELRRSLFAQIIPQITVENPSVKKLTTEEELASVKKILEQQSKDDAERKQKDAEKDAKLADMQKEIDALKQDKAKPEVQSSGDTVPPKPVKPKGRPKKVKTEGVPEGTSAQQ